MKTARRTALFAFAFCVGNLSSMAFAQTSAPAELDRHNVVWTTPSKDASGSMPIGNGEVGLNVWVEENGDLLFYIARTDAWSECSRLLKLGRIRVSLSPNPFAKGQPFRQELRLRDGQIVVTAGDAVLRVFVDSDAPVVYVMGESKTPRTITAKLENWRTERHVIKGDELQSCWTMLNAPATIEVWESPDMVADSVKDAVLWHHRNEYSVVPLTLKHQGIESLADSVHDPLLNRTFGGRMFGQGFVKEGANSLKLPSPVTQFAVAIATHSSQPKTVAEWQNQVADIAGKANATVAAQRTAAWWNAFWGRSWIFADSVSPMLSISSKHTLRLGVDSNGGSRFAGQIADPLAYDHPLSPEDVAKLAATKPGNPTTVAPADIPLEKGFTVAAWIKPAEKEAGRIFDKLTAGKEDGFLFDTHPGLSLRLIIGNHSMAQPNCLKAGQWQHVALVVDTTTGAIQMFLDGKLLQQVGGGSVTGAYVLQRWITACGGRGNYPIKFNGSIFTVDPKFSGGPNLNADWRRWGDSFWWQNTRLPYFPMIARGDFDQVRTLFRFYRDAVPLCKARAKLYHNVDGAYFPETMTIFGTYANGDYGWDRKGHEPKEVLSPWWCYAWQQGLELAALMLDYYEYTEDAKFLNEELIPMAHDVLRYYDTRFSRDANGKLVISPAQAAETYWFDVINDTPSVAGLHNVLDRLLAIPSSTTPAAERELWQRLKAAVPAMPLQTENGKTKIRPAEKFKPQRNNCENPELYAIWPFPVYGVGRPDLAVGVETFQSRIEKASIGWQYDGQCAARVGLIDEAKRILLGKVGNSNANHRFPAMWGPNYDWLPDQDHGSNIMLTIQTMLLDSAGDKIFLMPAWPKDWDVSFKLLAPRQTTIECVYRHGKIEKLNVTPTARQKDIQLPTWLSTGAP